MKAGIGAVLILGAIVFLPGLVESRAQEPSPVTAGLVLTVSAGPADPVTLMDPTATAWQLIPVKHIALNRTPRLFDTEPASELEIPELAVRAVHAGGQLVVRLDWSDPTEDSAKISLPPGAPSEGRFLKEHTEATNRFFDAAAIMIPAGVKAGPAAPSLQMGDANDPVIIYYWNAARGPMLMEAVGRETTRRTGQSFPAKAIYQDGAWHVTLELPGQPQGIPLAFAVWNGSQQDRDGRKYFSVWHWLQ